MVKRTCENCSLWERIHKGTTGIVGYCKEYEGNTKPDGTCQWWETTEKMIEPRIPWSVEQTIENLRIIKKHYKEVVRKANRDGLGERDAEEVVFDFDRAIAALEKIENAVGSGYLEDWYINSVSQDDDPVWTEAHIEELCNDFILIPKAVEK